jgi:mono/diheme cytochrome c family protein
MRLPLALALVLAAAPLAAQDRNTLPGSDELGANVNSFTATDGKALYLTACSGCHGPRGEGAEGAGHYPALANNPKLGSVRYPVNLIVEGNGAMPSFAEWLDDEQVAAVTEYIRGRWGNGYSEPVSAEMVGEMRAEFAEIDGG